MTGDETEKIVQEYLKLSSETGEKILFTSLHLHDERLAKMKILEDIPKEENLKTPDGLLLFLEDEPYLFLSTRGIL